MTIARSLKGLGSVHYAGVLLASVIVLSAACNAASDPGSGAGPRRGPGSHADGGVEEDPENPTDDPANPTKPNDPTTGSGTPTGDVNNGPPVNVSGYEAVKPLLLHHCGECHHAGSYLSFDNGADAATAKMIVDHIEKGTMPPAPREAVPAADIAKIKAWRDGQAGTAVTVNDDPSNIAVTQILDASTLATYKAALPKIAYARLQKILLSPSTLFYDKESMPGAYQDTVGNGADVPFGARLNSQGASLIVPQGRKLFNAAGNTWEFPFGHTAGADASTNAIIVTFISLPAQNGKLLPVAYKIETSTANGFPNTRWNWSYPKGTVIGEIIMIKDGATLVTAEIRTRERFADKWATNAFRPFPTAKSLAEAVKVQKPGWEGTPNLKTLVGALENTGSLTAKRLDSPAFANLVTLEGVVDAPLPDFGDPTLVKDLLTKTQFVASYGTTWKTNGTTKSFGFTGPASGLSIVPTNYDTGLLEVRETTCAKCHDQGGYVIADLVSEAVLYGDIWGVDRVFSFYPFDPTRIDASGNENRVVRPAFATAGLFEKYDAAKHPATLYSFFRPTK